MNQALFFDIDGTLLVAPGAGRSAFARAIEDVFDLTLDMRPINFAGATDMGVVTKLLDEQACAYSQEQLRQFFHRLSVHLEVNLTHRSPELYPGVFSFLERAAVKYPLALVTGNARRCAELKLQHTGIDQFFTMVGGYGDDDACRIRMTELAMERIDAREGYLFGDTPRDIQAAKATGLIAVAVTTGTYDRNSLAVHDPDMIIESFEQVEELVKELGL